MTTTAINTLDINTLSTEDLEKALAKKKATEKEERKAMKEDYEWQRDALVSKLCNNALSIADDMKKFKSYSFEAVSSFQQLMLRYGAIRKGDANKGNFEIKNENYKVTFSSQVRKSFDERSQLAEEKLKSFLSTFVKKRDKDLHDLVLSLLERNPKSGDLDISNIQRLYKLEDRFDNDDWRDAIRLFKESYNPEDTANYIRFFQKDENGAWQLINLKFSNI